MGTHVLQRRWGRSGATAQAWAEAGLEGLASAIASRRSGADWQTSSNRSKLQPGSTPRGQARWQSTRLPEGPDSAVLDPIGSEASRGVLPVFTYSLLGVLRGRRILWSGEGLIRERRLWDDRQRSDCRETIGREAPPPPVTKVCGLPLA
jgi:hypothetical protein